MTEMVLVIPLLAIVIALLFYFGRLVVRVHHASLMARYETWRHADAAPGPSSNDDLQHIELNGAFFNGNASEVVHAVDDDDFPEQPYRDMISAAGEASPEAGALADAVVYRQGGDFRNSHGHREGFGIFHEDTLAVWERLNRVTGDRAAGGETNPEQTALSRRFFRIGTDWQYNRDWRASADIWARSGPNDPHPLRARRDAFFMSFDEDLDSVDGSTSPEYGGGRSQVPGDSLAGMVRDMYLMPPAYRGPRVQ